MDDNVEAQRWNTPLLIIFGLFDMAMLITGITQKDECPINSNIPVYLIVAGVLGLGTKLLHVINTNLEWRLISLGRGIIYVVELIWICMGSYWVYSIYEPNYIPDSGDYCTKTAYLLAFWFLTFHWCLLAISIFLCFCCVGSALNYTGLEEV